MGKGKLDEKRQTLLLCVAGVLVVMLLPGRWAWESIQSTREDVAAVQAQTKKFERQAHAGEAVANRIDEWNARLAAVQTAIPMEEEFEEVNQMIAAAARAAGVTWKVGRPSAATSSEKARTIGNAKVYAFGLSEISGAPLQVSDFLTQLTTLDRVVVIDHVEWREELVAGVPTVRADLKVGYLAGDTTKPTRTAKVEKAAK